MQPSMEMPPPMPPPMPPAFPPPMYDGTRPVPGAGFAFDSSTGDLFGLDAEGKVVPHP